MRFLYLALGCLALPLVASAQSKIKDGTVSGSGSLPNSAAILELESSNKGLLYPRVALSSNTTTWSLTGSPIAGMAVYNTNAALLSVNTAYPALAGGIGIYYWDGTGWVGTKPSAGGDFWSLTGNAGTDPLVNFLGTTDSKPLRFKANNVYSGYIGLTSYPGGGSQDLNTAFGYGAGGDVVNRMTTTGAFRKMTAVGHMALGGATLAAGANLTENTAIGFEAGKALAGTSHRNTMVGSIAGGGISQGTLNTLVGQAAMASATGGDGNVFVGQGTGSVSTGPFSNNTYIGTQAGLNSGGSGNIHIGYNAGYNNAASNRLMIDNSQTNTPLIDGDMANRVLTVNNSLVIRGSFTSPIKSVTADYTLTETDYTVVCRQTSAITISLPDPATCAGRMYYIINNGTVSVNTNYSFEVATGVTQNFIPRALQGISSPNPNFGQKYLLQSDGTQWVLISLG